jgi:hypothetical protein
MNDIYYLVHASNKNLDKAKYLLAPSCINTTNNDQFPGVYFTLVSKYNIDTESYFPAKYRYIFSMDLLRQHNYHMNIQDSNGSINESRTYFPWQLQQFVDKIKEDPYKYNMNEVVFHDNISMAFCCKKLKKGVDILPRKAMTTKAKIDSEKLPFYCFMNEDIYTGYPPMKSSSISWFKTLAKVAGIQNKYYTKQEYIKMIRSKSVYLCKNRHLQNINILKKYTKSMKYYIIKKYFF